VLSSAIPFSPNFFVTDCVGTVTSVSQLLSAAVRRATVSAASSRADPALARADPPDVNRLLAPTGPTRHTRGMGQEHDDYADHDVPNKDRVSWLWRTAAVVGVLLLFLFVLGATAVFFISLFGFRGMGMIG
jgi:hypothetical protein